MLLYKTGNVQLWNFMWKEVLHNSLTSKECFWVFLKPMLHTEHQKDDFLSNQPGLLRVNLVQQIESVGLTWFSCRMDSNVKLIQGHWAHECHPLCLTSQVFFNPKVTCSKSNHPRVVLPFLQAVVDKNIFRSFFRERKVNLERNTSGFVFFQTFLNYL